MKISKHIEEKVKLTQASFAKRFFCSFLDILFVILINVPMFLVLAQITGGTSDGQFGNWNNLQVKPLTMMAFSIYIFFIFLIYMVYLPIHFKHQTIFSMIFGIKAITLTGGKPKIQHWFKSFFVVVFLSLLVNIILFAFSSSLDIKVFELSFNVNTTNPLEKYWKTPLKIMFLATTFVQLHYLFTVALSINPINWFTKFSNLVFIDINKELFFYPQDFEENELDKNHLMFAAAANNADALLEEEDMEKEDFDDMSLYGDDDNDGFEDDLTDEDDDLNDIEEDDEFDQDEDLEDDDDEDFDLDDGLDDDENDDEDSEFEDFESEY